MEKRCGDWEMKFSSSALIIKWKIGAEQEIVIYGDAPDAAKDLYYLLGCALTEEDKKRC